MIARPADIPNRPRAPLTPPRSAENSFDSKKSRSSDGSDVAGVPIGVPLDGDGMDVLRASLNRAESDGLEHEDPGDVKGEPTRAHWKVSFTNLFLKIAESVRFPEEGAHHHHQDR